MDPVGSNPPVASSDPGIILPPEPPNGLAAERALDVTLQVAAIQNRSKAVAKQGLVDRLRISVADFEMPPRRIDAEEGEQFEKSAVQTRQELLVPVRFRNARFSNFVPVTDSQREGLKIATRWTMDAYKGAGPMLAIIGIQGCGKSHLLYSAVNTLLLASRTTPLYARPWYLLADELRYGGPSIFAPRLQDEAQEVRTRLFAQRIVAIDEIRPTASTDFDTTELSKFACWAYDNRLSVIVTTNVNPLENIVGTAGASRFTQVVMEGPDHRHT